MNQRPNLITQAEYARRRGVAKSAVARAVAEGRINLIEGKIDEDVANLQWARNTRPHGDSASKVAAKVHHNRNNTRTTFSNHETPAENNSSNASLFDAPEEYADHRAQTEKYTAALKRIAYEKQQGSVVLRASTERAVFDAFRALRDAMMVVPQRAAPKVIGMNEMREIERVFADEIRKSFEGWEERMTDRLNQIVAEAAK